MPQQDSRAHLARIGVERFRGLADTEVVLEPGLTLVVGGNGQGKTSLMEAVYFLGTTKSFRTGQVRELVRSGANDATVTGRIAGSRPETLGIHLRVLPAGKELARAGKSVTVAAYLGCLNPVAFTVESRLLVRGAPELRRAFVDRGVADGRPQYLTEFAAFRRALSQKARLLENRAAGNEIEAWNLELGRRAAGILVERSTWVARLKKNFRRSQRECSGMQRRSKCRTVLRPLQSARASLG